MKILLAHTYFISEDVKEQEIMRPYPPLGILYISAYLKRKGKTVDLFDGTFSCFENLTQHIQKKEPEIVAIYTNLITKLNVIKLIKWLNEHYPKTITVLGGPDVTYNYNKYLEQGANYIVIGEGEETMYELVTALQTNNNLDTVDGIAYKKGAEIVKNTPRIKIKEIDSLPFPDRSAIDLTQYLDIWKSRHGSNTLSISTQRGCPYTCKWCSTAVYGQSYRRRSAKLVADEIEMLIETYNPDSLWFVDDVFTVSHKWISALHSEFKIRGIKIKLECITRAERLNDAILMQLKEMGCSKIWIGAESGSQKIIDEMDRRVDINLVKEMLIKTRKIGIETGTFIMLGYPKETIKDIYTTVQYLKDASPNNFTITITYPIVGTGLYEQIKEQIKTKEQDWATTTDRELDFDRTYSKRFYKYAVIFVVNSVNAHKNKNEGCPWFKQRIKAQLAKYIMLWNK